MPMLDTRQQSHEEKRQKALERLQDAVQSIQDSDTFKAFLELATRFHNYSWRNWLMIFWQRPDATRVAGFHTWKSLGRYVKRGEKAIWIVAPIIKKVESDDLQDEDPKEILVGFKDARVFDVSQTDGDDLPDVPVPILEGDAGAQAYEQLAAVAQKHFTLVDDQPIEINAVGYWLPSKKEIYVDPKYSLLQRAKTLAHELAHAFAGHGIKGDATDTREAETVAEAVAFLVCDHLGLDTSERSFPYIARFSQDMERFTKMLGEIRLVSKRILNELSSDN